MSLPSGLEDLRAQFINNARTTFRLIYLAVAATFCHATITFPIYIYSFAVL
jgi:hypothetical protein